MRKLFRILQYVTDVHRVHHIRWSYGWKLPFVKVGYFPTISFGRRHGFKRMRGHGVDYHDCTITGIY